MTQASQSRGGRPIFVYVYYLGVPMGLFRADHVKFYGLVLQPGTVSFPLGSKITLEFLSRDRKSGFRLEASIARITAEGMKVVFTAPYELGDQFDEAESLEVEGVLGE